MKTTHKLIALAIVLVGFTTTSNAQATATATATATVVAPISITKTSDMSFGNIAVQTSTGGTVILSTSNSRTASGGVTATSGMGGTVSSAAFTVSGEGTNTYDITLPGTVTLTRASGSETMTARTFTRAAVSGTLGTLSGGTQSFTVGATLTVAAGQATGTYTSANFNVTVNYN